MSDAKMMLLADGDGDLILYGIAVVGFLVVSAVINKAQKWWADLNKPATRGPDSPPTSAPPRPTAPGRPRRPPAPTPSLPRPVIREQLPQGGPPPVRPPIVRGPQPASRTGGPDRPPIPRERPRPPAKPARVEPERKPVAKGPPLVAATPTASASAAADAVAHLSRLSSEIARPAAQPVKTAVPSTGSPSLTMSGVMAVRLSRDELRKAMVVNEILSPPLALRET